MSRRRTGAVAVGVGALTAVVLSLAGTKTPVVLWSAGAIGVAVGVVAGRKGAGKSVSITKQLVGEELLVKVKELEDGSKSELVRLCGYVSTNKDGEERLNFTAFYEALLEAKGGTVSSPEPDSKTESLAQEEQSISHDEKSKRFDMLKQRLIEEGIDDDDLDRVLSELKAIGITEVETFECQKDYHYETHHQFLVSEFKNKIREYGDADSEMDPELEDCVDWDKVDAYFTKDGWRSIQMDDWGYTYFYING